MGHVDGDAPSGGWRRSDLPQQAAALDPESSTWSASCRRSRHQKHLLLTFWACCVTSTNWRKAPGRTFTLKDAKWLCHGGNFPYITCTWMKTRVRFPKRETQWTQSSWSLLAPHDYLAYVRSRKKTFQKDLDRKDCILETAGPWK